MVELFGAVESSTVSGDVQTTIFRIPAVSKRIARQRAKLNARIKGLSNTSIEDIEKAGKADIPGQKFYDITVKSSR